YDHAGPDESQLELLSRLQHRLSQRLRSLAGPHRLRVDGAWRLLVARLLRDDGRADPGNLCAGARVILRRSEGISVRSLSVPHDRDEHGQAPQQSEHGVLENVEGRLRSLRGLASGTEGRRVREALRV